jgi:hypothetical protein
MRRRSLTRIASLRVAWSPRLQRSQLVAVVQQELYQQTGVVGIVLAAAVVHGFAVVGQLRGIDGVSNLGALDRAAPRFEDAFRLGGSWASRTS